MTAPRKNYPQKPTLIRVKTYQNLSKYQHILLKMLMNVAYYTLGMPSYIFLREHLKNSIDSMV